MADYKNIPVDPETYRTFQQVCKERDMKQGQMIRFWVKEERARLNVEQASPTPETDKLPAIDEVA